MDNSKKGKSLLVELERLRERLISSGVERTVGLNRSMGDSCPYYRKSLDLFLKKDYQDIKNLISNINQLFKEIG